MENQHRMIKTYRELSATEIALMNACKEMEARVEDLLSRIHVHLFEENARAVDVLSDPNASAADASAARAPTATTTPSLCAGWNCLAPICRSGSWNSAVQ